MALQTLSAGSNYTLKLTPKQPLTQCQINQATQLLSQRSGEIKQRFGVDISNIQVQPNNIAMTIHAGILIQVDPFLYFLFAILGTLGIAIITWQIIALLVSTPLAWVFGIFGLAFGAYVLYTWEKRTRKR